MAEKTEPKKHEDPRVTIQGKVFNWATEDGATLTIPLRVKMKTLRELNDVPLDADGMYQTVVALDPDQAATIDDMDANDFTAAFEAWQSAYQASAGVSLGEASSSSS